MNKVFNFEGPVFTFLSRLADLFWLNLLYILCCLPVITAGAATTALFYVTLKMAKDEEGYITRSFFKSFKDNFIQATLIWAAFLVVFVIMYLDFRIANGGSMAEVLSDSFISDASSFIVSSLPVPILTCCSPL